MCVCKRVKLCVHVFMSETHRRSTAGATSVPQFAAFLTIKYPISPLRFLQPNPKPTTQYPKPKTQNPKPKTQNPKPKTPNPKPKTQNPKPKTQNPKPKTQNPIRQTGAGPSVRGGGSFLLVNMHHICVSASCVMCNVQVNMILLGVQIVQFLFAR